MVVRIGISPPTRKVASLPFTTTRRGLDRTLAFPSWSKAFTLASTAPVLLKSPSLNRSRNFPVAGGIVSVKDGLTLELEPVDQSTPMALDKVVESSVTCMSI